MSSLLRNQIIGNVCLKTWFCNVQSNFIFGTIQQSFINNSLIINIASGPSSQHIKKQQSLHFLQAFVASWVEYLTHSGD